MRCPARYEDRRSLPRASAALRRAPGSAPAFAAGTDTKDRIGGFTLIEVLVTVGIVALMVSLSAGVYVTFSRHESLEIATVGVVEAIRHAQANAQAGKGDAAWGVKFAERSVTVFRGASYSGRAASDDQTMGFPGGVKAGGLGEIVFSEYVGATTNVGTVVLSNDLGQRNISVNAKGTVSY